MNKSFTLKVFLMRHIKFAILLSSFGIGLLGCNSAETTQPSATVSSEMVAREAIGSILFDQRTHYIENQNFATTIKDLRKTNVVTDSLNYAYQVKTKRDKASGIVVTASAKQENLRSFTGVVFVIPTTQGPLTVSEICESVDPSKNPPTAPAIPKLPSDAIQCPAGSRTTFAVVAGR